MKHRKKEPVTVFLFGGLLVLASFLRWPGGAAAISLPECISDSGADPQSFIDSAPCGAYGVVTTRTKLVDGVPKEIKVQFMVHEPSGSPKALVVLFAGGNGNTGITLNAGGALTAGRNFLVRSAQLFAERGYKAVTIDRPLLELGPPKVPEFPTIPDYDLYRVSTDHRIDIEAVLAAVDAPGLPVFFAGTSRGTLSAVAQHSLSLALSLSSAVTSGTNLYIGHPDRPNLQPGSVSVPVRILAHEQDGCSVTAPQNAVKLHVAFKQAEVDSHYNSVDGGFDLTGQTVDGVTIAACDALTHHGYLGIENEAVDQITKRFDQILRRLNKS
ncbi:MAG TPA: hypothetical protein VNL14_10370 [Candidatus Acidoferrales bacterium]|nr:hypothetical protein [Candidatus Acidoferrales bacterium]